MDKLCDHRLTTPQVAYLMADVSNVQTSDIKEIHDGLEALSCKLSDLHMQFFAFYLLTLWPANIMTRVLY